MSIGLVVGQSIFYWKCSLIFLLILLMLTLAIFGVVITFNYEAVRN